MDTKLKPLWKRTKKQFLVDEKGRRTAVLLPIEEYDELLEVIEQREDVRRLEAGKRMKGEDIPWEEVKARLKAQGKLT